MYIIVDGGYHLLWRVLQCPYKVYSIDAEIWWSKALESVTPGAYQKKTPTNLGNNLGKNPGLFIQKNSRAYRIRYLKPLFRKNLGFNTSVPTLTIQNIDCKAVV